MVLFSAEIIYKITLHWIKDYESVIIPEVLDLRFIISLEFWNKY